MNQDNDKGLPTSGETPPLPEADNRQHYSLVLAEVVFQTKGNKVSSERCQLFSRAEVDIFPAARLMQIQNSAAAQVRDALQLDEFQAIEVLILGIHPLGRMSEEEFHHPQDKPETPAKQDSNNVVDLRRT